MRTRLLDLLCCSKCRNDLNLQPHIVEGSNTISGELHCLGCGARYTISDGIPRMNRTSDPDADLWSCYWGRDGKSLVDRLVNSILSPMTVRACARSMLMNTSSGVILEVGGGLAQTSHRVCGIRGDEIINLDITPRALQMARAESERRGLGLMLIEGNAQAIPVKSGAVDVAFNLGTIEHFDDPVPIVIEMARVASTVICAVPAAGLIWTMGRIVRSHTEHDASLWVNHTRLFNQAQLRDVFVGAGLQGIRVQTAKLFGLSLLLIAIGVRA